MATVEARLTALENESLATPPSRLSRGGGTGPPGATGATGATGAAGATGATGPAASGEIDAVVEHAVPTDGTSDCRASIQAALDAASSSTSRKIVRLQAGTFVVTLGDSALSGADWKVGLQIPSNVTLRGAGINRTIIKLAAAQEPGAQHAQIVVNRDFTSAAPRDANIIVSDLTIDGNANGQSGTQLHHGLVFRRADHCRAERVRVVAVRGTASGPPDERFHFDATTCHDITFLGCEADGRNAGSANTASGFSANGSNGVRWIDCVGHDMKVARGFTAFHCDNVQWSACWAFRNAGGGFAAEECFGWLFTNCIAGGTVNADINPAGEVTAGEDLGNDIGFSVKRWANSTRAAGTISACQAINNNWGISLNGNEAGTPDARGIYFHVVGCHIEGSAKGIQTLNGGHYMSRVADTEFRDNTADGDYSTGTGAFAAPGSTRIRRGARPKSHAGTDRTPAVPASGTAQRNPFPYDCMVTVLGGMLSGSGIEIGHQLDSTTYNYESLGTTTDLTVLLPANAAIRPNYSVAPTWHWIMVV